VVLSASSDARSWSTCGPKVAFAAATKISTLVCTRTRAFCTATLHGGNAPSVVLLMSCPRQVMAGLSLGHRPLRVSQSSPKEASRWLTVRLSIGVVARRPGMTGEELFRAADERLYEAKRRGRGRVAD
jgi:diguanylate cyclase (GGDEF)-like protein